MPETSTTSNKGKEVAAPKELTVAPSASKDAGKQSSLKRPKSNVSDPNSFEMVDFLDEATSMLDKVRNTAQNVTTCQNQIDQIFARCGILLETLLTDSMEIDGDEVKAAATTIKDIFDRLHKLMLRFAIFGRSKAFVHRADLTESIEAFNMELSTVLASFAKTKHPEVEEWEADYYQAKMDDEDAGLEELWEISINEADVKSILGYGKDACEDFVKHLRAAIKNPKVDKTRRQCFQIVISQVEAWYQELADLEAGDFSGSAAAKAKREEAMMEKLNAKFSANEPEYDAPPPVWEPRRPPAGSGAGAGSGGDLEIRPSDDAPEYPPPEYT